jgi:rare lipoprotein A (peptidoglycan hydrolase)
MGSDTIKKLLLTVLIAMMIIFSKVNSFIASERFLNAPTGQHLQHTTKPGIDTEKDETLVKGAIGGKKMIEYIIRQDDSLSEIAIKFFGSQEKWRAIAEANNIKNLDEIQIHVGQSLLIPLEANKSSYQVGTASWYGADFHGKKTASGKRFDMHSYTAAHRSLPIGTVVRVVNLKNGRDVIVKINDRGPYIKGRIIDLSYAAAKSLEMVRSGITKVKVEVISAPV